MQNKNDELLAALADKQLVIDGMQEFTKNFDDGQLKQLDKFNRLSVMEKDLLYLRTSMKLREIADLYSVTPANIHLILKGIHKKLQK